MVSSSSPDGSGFVPIPEHLPWTAAQGWSCLTTQGVQLWGRGSQSLVTEHLFLQKPKWGLKGVLQRQKGRDKPVFGGGDGSPPQRSCLENPRDRGAWWAAVFGVAQSWTRLKRLNSSSYSLPCARRSKHFMDGQSSQQIYQLAASPSCLFSFLNYKIYKTKMTILNIFKCAVQWH